MSESVTITLTPDEALVLFEFFARSEELDDFTMRHTAEYLAFWRISALLESTLVDPFLPNYGELLNAARERLTEGYEGEAPFVVYG